jgi:hypothetical protein
VLLKIEKAMGVVHCCLRKLFLWEWA